MTTKLTCKQAALLSTALSTAAQEYGKFAANSANGETLQKYFQRQTEAALALRELIEGSDGVLLVTD